MARRPAPGRLDQLSTERPLDAALPPDDGGDSSGPGPLGRRILRPETLISFAAAVAILVFFFRRLDIQPDEIWRQVRTANPWIYALAFVVWYGSFAIRALRWRRMLHAVGVEASRLPGERRMIEILLLSWFANCVVPAKLGDAYRGFLLKQESRVPFSTAFGTIVAERLSDLSILCLLMSGVGLALFHGHVPSAASQTFLLGLALLVIATVVLAAMWLSRHTLHRMLPARFRGQYARLHEAMFRSFRQPWWIFGPGILIWVGEGVRFWLVARALDAPITVPIAIFVAVMGSLLTTLPLTPAGLGVVEAGTGAVMVSVFGINSSVAISVILLDRVVAYWSLILVGAVLYVRRFHRETRSAVGEPASEAAG